MGWVEDLHGKVVGLDTSPLIYYIEEHPLYVDILRPFFDAVDRGEILVVTSTVTLLEVLVHPFRQGNKRLARQYRDILFYTKGVTIIPLTQEIAEEAALLRAFHSVRTPDSIQMATAIRAGASFFLTNDARLPSLPKIQLLELDKLRTRLQN